MEKIKNRKVKNAKWKRNDKDKSLMKTEMSHLCLSHFSNILSIPQQCNMTQTLTIGNYV